MSAAIVALTDRRPTTLPDVVARKVAAFLAAGNTGKIVLNVKEGRVLAYEITDAGRICATELDSNGQRHEDLGK